VPRLHGGRTQLLLVRVCDASVPVFDAVVDRLCHVCTAVVICRNKYMHTATNYYLCNLVISDLLFLALGLPVETYSFWSAYHREVDSYTTMKLTVKPINPRKVKY